MTSPTGSTTDAAVVARRWVTDLMSVGTPDRADRYVAFDCRVHVDGSTIASSALRSLVEAHHAVLPVAGVDVEHVVAWQDKAMVAYTVRHTLAMLPPEPARATVFVTVSDGRITEAWFADDWPDWLEGHLRAG